MVSRILPLPGNAEWGFFAPDSPEDPRHTGDLTVAEVTLPRQTHSANVAVAHSLHEDFPDTDALITRMKGVAIGIRTADCVPILMYAPDIEAVAAIHAGWKGTLAGIAPRAFLTLRDMGADPHSISVRTGAHICGACYEVDDNLAARFSDAGLGECIRHDVDCDPLAIQEFVPSRPHLDLGEANRIMLIREGMDPHNYLDIGICTRHSIADGFRLPSWRRTPGERRRIVSWIRLTAAESGVPVK